MSSAEKPEAKPSDCPPRARTRTMATIGIALLALFLILLAVGVVPRLRNRRALASGAEDVRNAVPAVHVLQPTAATEAGLTLAAHDTGHSGLHHLRVGPVGISSGASSTSAIE